MSISFCPLNHVSCCFPFVLGAVWLPCCLFICCCFPCCSLLFYLIIHFPMPKFVCQCKSQKESAAQGTSHTSPLPTPLKRGSHITPSKSNVILLAVPKSPPTSCPRQHRHPLSRHPFINSITLDASKPAKRQMNKHINMNRKSSCQFRRFPWLGSVYTTVVRGFCRQSCHDRQTVSNTLPHSLEALQLPLTWCQKQDTRAARWINRVLVCCSCSQCLHRTCGFGISRYSRYISIHRT